MDVSGLPSKALQEISNCSTDATLEGDSFEDVLKEGQLVVFVHEKGPLECYSREELENWFAKQEKLYYWGKGGAQKERPIYKLIHTAIWICKHVHDLVFLQNRACILLFKLEDHAIGSSFGVSQTHGAVFPIYDGIPITLASTADLSKPLGEFFEEKLSEVRENYSFISKQEEIKIDPKIKDARVLIELLKLQMTPEELLKATQLSLSDKGLTTLPKEISNLTALRKLYLYDNRLTKLPKEIGNLAALQILNLSNNKLAALPKEIGNLVALQELYLSENRLTTLPKEIGNLVALQDLELSINNLTTLPIEIGGLVSLQKLYLPGNQLTTLPKEIGDLTSLQKLFLSNNQLTTLPKEIGGIPTLQELYLSGNQLTTVPKEIKNLVVAKQLYIVR
jgi:hypothetical protein